MRIVLTVGMLLVLGFAGCIGDDGLDTDSVVDVQAKYKQGDWVSEMPDERSFDGTAVLETEKDLVAQGDAPEMRFDVTDMKDYPFPVTFVDWALFHDRNPNPVSEGDATDLPGNYNQTLYAKGYHMFGFRVDDTQGINETEILILEVGDHEDELPTPYEIAHFRWRIDTYFGDQGTEPLPPQDETPIVIDEPVGDDIIIIERTLSAPRFCLMCVESDPTASHTPPPLGAKGCTGFMSGVNQQDCAWVNILPASWGEPFEVTSTYREGEELMTPGDEGSVDVDFLDSCRPTGESLGLEFIDHSHSPGGVTGIVPEGARCMVAFELEIVAGGGVDFHFEWTERPAEPLDDPWFHPTLGLGYIGIATTPWYDGVLMQSDVDSGCVGNGATCGPAVCPGLATGQNGHGCAWMHVTSNMWGLRFSAFSAGDVDGLALTECAPDAATVGSSFGAFGPETGFSPLDGSSRVIPEGAGCIYVSDFAGQSPRVEFTVISNP